MLSGVTERFSSMLAGGHPNSLGRTEEVVGIVCADRARLEELFATMADPDEVVRMRVGDALEKICRRQPMWFVPQIDRLLGDLGPMTQPSVQWHVAQMLDHLHGDLSQDQERQAVDLLQRNLVESTDWIVLNVTMDVLAAWSEQQPALVSWLVPQLERLRHDHRRSVATRAAKRLAQLTA